MGESGPFGRPSDLLITAHTLAVDGVTATVVRELREAGIPSVVLKGPTLAGWLYDDGAARYYMDSDILVPPQRFDAAETVLERLGFALKPDQAPPERGLPHARPWVRASDRAEVDLHRTLSGVAVAPERAWDLIAPSAEPMQVGGEEVSVPERPIQALLVVLHAAQHGGDKPKPLQDLERALERVTDDEWREVLAVAWRLDAVANLTRGLRLLPAGEAVADRLGLFDTAFIEAAIARGSFTQVALGFERLAATPGLAGKLALVARELVPAPASLRWWSPIARRGRAGLCVAYVWRPLWVAWHALPSLRAWLRARRAAGPRRTAASKAP